VTFSVAKDHYDSYQDIFDKIIATLKVFDQKGNAQGNWKPKGEEKDLLADGTYIPDGSQNPDIGMQKKNKGGSGDSETTTLIGIILVAAIAFFLIKMRKKKKGKK
jgi:LPXTG-motif cell wall-anchored protein